MSRCHREGFWRAFADGEVDDMRRGEAERHLADCARCQAVYQEVCRNKEFVGASLLDLERDALTELSAASASLVGSGVHRRLAPRRVRLALLAAAAILLAALLALTPLVSIAENSLWTLSLERPQLVDRESMKSDRSSIKKGLLGTTTVEHAKSLRSISEGRAKGLLEGYFYEPASLPPGVERISISGIGESRVELLLKSSSENEIPEKYEGARISMLSPAAVRSIYAPKGSKEPRDALVLDQGRVPELNISKGLPVSFIKAELLNALPQPLRRQFEGEGWRTALPLASRKGVSRQENVRIGEQEGVLITTTRGEKLISITLVWTSEKRVFALSILGEGIYEASDLTGIALGMTQ